MEEVPYKRGSMSLLEPQVGAIHKIWNFSLVGTLKRDMGSSSLQLATGRLIANFIPR